MKEVLLITVFLISLLLTSCNTKSALEHKEAENVVVTEPPVSSAAPIEEQKTEEKPVLAVQDIENVYEIQIGDTVTFGTYNGLPLEWYVIDTNDNAVLLLTRYVLTDMKFTSQYDLRNLTGTEGIWAYSDIREWLNGDFYNSSFSESEKSKIIKKALSTTYYDKDKNELKSETEDFVFVPDPNEAMDIDINMRKGVPTEVANLSDAESFAMGNKRWWTRGPNANYKGADPGYVAYVSSQGDVNLFVPDYEETGVRAEIWVKIGD